MSGAWDGRTERASEGSSIGGGDEALEVTEKMALPERCGKQLGVLGWFCKREQPCWDGA